VHQIRFRPGSRPRLHWKSLHRSPDPIAGLGGLTYKGRGEEGEGKGEKKGRGREFLDPRWSGLYMRAQSKRTTMVDSKGKKGTAAPYWPQNFFKVSCLVTYKTYRSLCAFAINDDVADTLSLTPPTPFQNFWIRHWRRPTTVRKCHKSYAGWRMWIK